MAVTLYDMWIGKVKKMEEAQINVALDGMFGPDTSILDDAAKTLANRQAAYAPPSVNLQRIADMWSVIVEKKLTPKEVSLMMVALKITREMNAYDRDNWEDMIGYAAIGDLVSK